MTTRALGLLIRIAAKAAAVAIAASSATACTAPDPSAPRAHAPATTSASASVTASASASASAATIASAAPSASPTPSAAPAASSRADFDADPFGSEEADHILFVDPNESTDARAACRGDKPEKDRIRCLVALRYREDAIAAKTALDLYAQSGSIAGLDAARSFDGKYRGILQFVPAMPVGANRKHLEWLAAAFRDYEAFFQGIGPATDARFRWRTLAIRFFKSVGVRTPAAYAQGWAIAYNVDGSLNASAESVRETMFHELFHLNDEFHRDWSDRALGKVRAAIVARCGDRTACLAPYAPSSTMVRGSTYYAFHPANNVEEYAAELALRYYREERAALRHEKLGAPPFKCGPPENAEAWRALAVEFFGGADHVPACVASASAAPRPK